jgi:hypothetical protein
LSYQPARFVLPRVESLFRVKALRGPESMNLREIELCAVGNFERVSGRRITARQGRPQRGQQVSCSGVARAITPPAPTAECPLPTPPEMKPEPGTPALGTSSRSDVASARTSPHWHRRPNAPWLPARRRKSEPGGPALGAPKHPKSGRPGHRRQRSGRHT